MGNHEDGSVVFYGKNSNDEKYQFTLRKVNDRAEIIATSTSDNSTTNEELSLLMSDFFNNLVFELDGTFLKFHDMQLTSVKNKDWLLLRLNIKVRKFPSP